MTGVSVVATVLFLFISVPKVVEEPERSKEITVEDSTISETPII